MSVHKCVTRRAFLSASAMSALALAGCAAGSENQPAETPEATEATTAISVDDLPWWKKSIVYEAYPKSFQSSKGAETGDIAGVTSRLDYLKELGVGAIWLTPVFVSPMADNGYDVADYYNIDPPFGTMEDMDKLMAEAANRDIKIVLDMVVNHTSNENAWFVESSSSKDNDKADWYIWRDPAEDGGAPNNWRGIFGGSAWTYVEARDQYYLHTFLPEQPDLNWDNEAVRKEVANVFNFWRDKGAGGFRVDAVTYIKKPEGLPDGDAESDGFAPIHNATANTPGILDYLHELRDSTIAGTDCFMVGEANGVQASELSDWVGESGVFDMVFEFSHMDLDGHDASWIDAHSWKLVELKDALSATQANTAANGWCPVFFENHDQPRCVINFFPEGSNTDQAAKCMATVQLGLRGTPFLYEGQELGFANVAWPSIDYYNDPSSHNQYNAALAKGHTEEEALACVHRFSRDNARTPMQWDTSNNAGFTTGEKTWLPVHDDYATQNAAVESDQADSVLNYFRSMAALREGNDILLAGSYEEVAHDHEQVYAYVRELDGKKVLVMANFTNEEAPLDDLASQLTDAATILMDSYGDVPDVSSVLRPLEARVCEL
ncbi:MAG: alpha-glucosidase [Atopobiaceae bacterium]|nr:alpha-glucosidase [Atopobiaceae bacterium]